MNLYFHWIFLVETKLIKVENLFVGQYHADPDAIYNFLKLYFDRQFKQKVFFVIFLLVWNIGKNPHISEPFSIFVIELLTFHVGCLKGRLFILIFLPQLIDLFLSSIPLQNGLLSLLILVQIQPDQPLHLLLLVLYFTCLVT